MRNSIFPSIAALAAPLMLFTSTAPIYAANENPEIPVQPEENLSAPIRIIIQQEVNPEFKSKYTQRFIEAIRAGNNHLSYEGDFDAAKKSLSEIVSFYCSIKTPVHFFDCKDASGTFLEIKDGYWTTVHDAVLQADQDWKAYEDYVVSTCRQFDLSMSDKDLVDAINKYICQNYDYQITHSSMPYFVITHTGQCWHYAKLFADMCNTLGIEAKKIETTTHAWVDVTIDGITYTFDPTYNDTSGTWTSYSWQNPRESGTNPEDQTRARLLKTGWIQDGDNWLYFNEAGIQVKGSWVYDNYRWYYLDQDGIMLKSSWLKNGDKWYYLDGSGAMLKSRWVQSGEFWHYLLNDGTMAVNAWVDGCYVDENGVWTA